MPFPFNKNLDVKLIQLVEENACLYNHSDPKYSDLNAREVVWQMIGDALGRPAHMCKSRWINIRDMMRRKLRDRIRNPSQLSYHYKYEDRLSFMLPHFKESASLPTIDYAEFDENCDTEALEQPEYLEEPAKSDTSQRKHEEFTENISEKQHSFSNQRDLNSSTDPLEVFLLTIGSTLRKFSPYFLNQAKSKIFQVVQDYELEQIVNKDGRVSISDVLSQK